MNGNGTYSASIRITLYLTIMLILLGIIYAYMPGTIVAIKDTWNPQEGGGNSQIVVTFVDEYNATVVCEVLRIQTREGVFYEWYNITEITLYPEILESDSSMWELQYSVNGHEYKIYLRFSTFINLQNDTNVMCFRLLDLYNIPYTTAKVFYYFVNGDVSLHTEVYNGMFNIYINSNSTVLGIYQNLIDSNGNEISIGNVSFSGQTDDLTVSRGYIYVDDKITSRIIVYQCSLNKNYTGYDSMAIEVEYNPISLNTTVYDVVNIIPEKCFQITNIEYNAIGNTTTYSPSTSPLFIFNPNHFDKIDLYVHTEYSYAGGYKTQTTPYPIPLYHGIRYFVLLDPWHPDELYPGNMKLVSIYPIDGSVHMWWHSDDEGTYNVSFIYHNVSSLKYGWLSLIINETLDSNQVPEVIFNGVPVNYNHLSWYVHENYTIVTIIIFNLSIPESSMEVRIHNITDSLENSTGDSNSIGDSNGTQWLEEGWINIESINASLTTDTDILTIATVKNMYNIDIDMRVLWNTTLPYHTLISIDHIILDANSITEITAIFQCDLPINGTYIIALDLFNQTFNLIFTNYTYIEIHTKNNTGNEGDTSYEPTGEGEDTTPIDSDGNLTQNQNVSGNNNGGNNSAGKDDDNTTVSYPSQQNTANNTLFSARGKITEVAMDLIGFRITISSKTSTPIILRLSTDGDIFVYTDNEITDSYVILHPMATIEKIFEVPIWCMPPIDYYYVTCNILVMGSNLSENITMKFWYNYSADDLFTVYPTEISVTTNTSIAWIEVGIQNRLSYAYTLSFGLQKGHKIIALSPKVITTEPRQYTYTKLEVLTAIEVNNSAEDIIVIESSYLHAKQFINIRITHVFPDERPREANLNITTDSDTDTGMYIGSEDSHNAEIDPGKEDSKMRTTDTSQSQDIPGSNGTAGDENTPSPWPNLETGVVISTISLLSIFCAVATTEWSKYGVLRRLIPPLIPLYTRITKENIFDNIKRKTIYEYILSNPGATLIEIKQVLKIPNGSAVYHLEILIENGLIFSKRDGRYIRFYPAKLKSNLEFNDFSWFQTLILDTIVNTPGITLKDLSKAIGKSKQVVQYHLRVLIENGYVYKARKDGIARFYPTEKMLAIQRSMDEEIFTR